MTDERLVIPVGMESQISIGVRWRASPESKLSEAVRWLRLLVSPSA